MLRRATVILHVSATHSERAGATSSLIVEDAYGGACATLTARALKAAYFLLGCREAGHLPCASLRARIAPPPYSLRAPSPVVWFGCPVAASSSVCLCVLRRRPHDSRCAPGGVPPPRLLSALVSPLVGLRGGTATRFTGHGLCYLHKHEESWMQGSDSGVLRQLPVLPALRWMRCAHVIDVAAAPHPKCLLNTSLDRPPPSLPGDVDYGQLWATCQVRASTPS